MLAERSGIERETAYDVFAGGVAAAPYVLYKREAFVRPEETPVAFTIDLMRKDLRLAFALAEELGVPLAAVRAADDVLAQADGKQILRAWPTSCAGAENSRAYSSPCSSASSSAAS